MYFTMHFIDGLKPKIKAIVLVQRPKTFDSACALVLLQEEVAGPVMAKPTFGGDWYSAYEPSSSAWMPLPLPPPLPRPEKPAPATTTSPTSTTSSADAKLAALKTYRCALGLCYKCGNKWSKDHRCPPKVLQGVDALWDSFSLEDSLADSSSDSSPFEHLMMALSKSAAFGIPVARTIRLMGMLQQVPVQILIDSGSSSSFINQSLVP